MDIRNIKNILVKEIKLAKSWLIFVPAGVLLFNFYIYLKFKDIPSMSRNAPMLLVSGIVILPLLIIAFIRGILILKSERDNRTIEYLKALPVNGFEIATAKSLMIGIESFAYAATYFITFRTMITLAQTTYSVRLTLWLLVLIWLVLTLTATFSLLLQAVGMSVRRFGRLIAAVLFLILSQAGLKIAGWLDPVLREFPHITLYVVYGAGTQAKGPMTLGTLILLAIYIVINVSLTGYLVENKMEV